MQEEKAYFVTLLDALRQSIVKFEADRSIATSVEEIVDRISMIGLQIFDDST